MVTPNQSVPEKSDGEPSNNFQRPGASAVLGGVFALQRPRRSKGPMWMPWDNHFEIHGWYSYLILFILYNGLYF